MKTLIKYFEDLNGFVKIGLSWIVFGMGLMWIVSLIYSHPW
jgi:hypothetical protein|tara:strand:- start:58 stop:180 length:123 start_codon:yes stop_codon:yes gene_type:complete